MPVAAQARRESGRARSELRARLEQRREEIEAAVLTRVRAITDSSEVADPAYAEGLRAAVSAAIAYGIETTGRETNEPPIPVPLLAQARMAARVGVPLDTVLRRYFAGYSLLGYFILEEATNAGTADGAELQRLLGAHAGIFDRLLAAVGEEHAREAEALRVVAGRSQAERIERLLAGEPLDTSEIAYDFEGWHLGLVAGGDGGERAVAELTARLDCRRLTVQREEDVVWAWLGTRHRLEPERLLDAAGKPEAASIALGEPAENLAGWRLTHRQAAAALPIALHRNEPFVRYAEVALLACARQDELLSTSLHRLYLAPLETERDGGETARQTLRAYFDARRNVSSTAFALGVNRNTVTSRLRSVERRLGRSLTACAADLETALRLRELGDLASPAVAAPVRLPAPRLAPTRQHDETFVQDSAH